jgi:hypothetical protein
MHATITSRSYRWYSRKIINGLLVSALLLAGAAVAEASDKKVYPGATCHQRGVLVGDSNVRYESSGTILNYGTVPVSIICPMVRDHTDRRPLAATIVVLDSHNGVTPTCSVRVLRPDGTVSASMPLINDPNVVQVGVKVFEFGGFSSVPPEDDAYFARCDSVPGHFNGALSGIFSYWLREDD